MPKKSPDINAIINAGRKSAAETLSKTKEKEGEIKEEEVPKATKAPEEKSTIKSKNQVLEKYSKPINDDINPKSKQNTPIPLEFSRKLNTIADALDTDKYILIANVLEDFFERNKSDLISLIKKHNEQLFK